MPRTFINIIIAFLMLAVAGCNPEIKISADPGAFGGDGDSTSDEPFVCEWDADCDNGYLCYLSTCVLAKFSGCDRNTHECVADNDCPENNLCNNYCECRHVGQTDGDADVEDDVSEKNESDPCDCGSMECGTRCGKSCGTCAANQICWPNGTCAANTGGDCGPMGGLQDGAPWPMEDYCPGLQRRSPYSGSQRPIYRWTFDGGESISPPVISKEDVIFIVAYEDSLATVYALDRSGATLWSRDYRGWRIKSIVITTDGSLALFYEDLNYDDAYVGHKYSIAWISPNDGQVLSEYGFGDMAVSRIVLLGDNRVMVNNLFLYDFNLGLVWDDGAWPDSAQKDIARSYPIGAGSFYPLSRTYIDNEFKEAIYSIDLDNGELNWSYIDTEEITRSSTAIGADGTVFVSWGRKYFMALDKTGREKWKIPKEYGSAGYPAISPRGVLYYAAEEHLVALSPMGVVMWAYEVPSGLSLPPTTDADGSVYVVDDDHSLIAVNPDGTEKFTYEADCKFKASPAIAADGMLIAACEGGKLIAIGP